MSENLVTTKQLAGTRVFGGKNGRKIGTVRRFVFHPTEKRCIGFTVKRPDAALMFHRKDLFVALDGYSMREDGILLNDDPPAADKGAVKRLGVDWDSCVLWVGMPVMTKSGDLLGYVDFVRFDRATGLVTELTTENGAANDAILGKRVIPASLVKGFRRGQGVALTQMGEYHGEDEDEQAERGAILVDDAALQLSPEGGAAAAAGKATAVVVNKTKQGVAKAKVDAEKAKVAVDKKVEAAKPTVRKVAKATDDAVQAGSFAVGKQLGKATGMFAAFKEEFDKASRGESGEG